jgi:hypothetical protein
LDGLRRGICGQRIASPATGAVKAPANNGGASSFVREAVERWIPSISRFSLGPKPYVNKLEILCLYIDHDILPAMTETDFERFSRIILDEFKRMHERFDRVEAGSDGIANRLAGIDQRLADLGQEITIIHRQLDALEGLVQSHSGFAKEIDHLLQRVAAIEKHLGIAYNIKA